MRMEDRTRLGLGIFLFGLLLVSVLILIRQVIPPVHVLPSDDENIPPPNELLGPRYETRYIDIVPYGEYKEVSSRKIKAKQKDASGNTIF